MNTIPLKRAWDGLNSLPFLHKIGIVAVLCGIAFMLSSAGAAWGESRHAKKFDKQMAAKEAQVQQLAADREKLITKAEAAETLAADRANSLAALYAQQPALEAQVKTAEQNLGKALESYEAEKSNTNRDVPASDRLVRYCRKRAELGYPCSGIAATGATGR